MVFWGEALVSSSFCEVYMDLVFEQLGYCRRLISSSFMSYHIKSSLTVYTC